MARPKFGSCAVSGAAKTTIIAEIASNTLSLHFVGIIIYFSFTWYQ
jgi:hypothetical protein